MKMNKLILGLATIFSLALISCGAKPSMEGNNGTESTSANTEQKSADQTAPVKDASLNPQSSNSSSSTELVWYGFEEGMEKAKKEKKVWLVDAYTDWCGWCKVMDRETYKNAEVIAKLNKDFVAVKFNPEIDKRYNVDGTTQTGEGLLMWLAQGNPGGYPTSYFVFNPSKNYNRAAQPGYLAPADFIKLLDLVLTKRGS